MQSRSSSSGCLGAPSSTRPSGGRYYARVGSTKQRLTSPELARLFQDRGRGCVFDEQPVFAADVTELDWNRLEAFFGRAPKIPWLNLLRNPRVALRDEQNTDWPLVADLLTFGNKPTNICGPPGSKPAATGNPPIVRRSDPRGAPRRPGARPD